MYQRVLERLKKPVCVYTVHVIWKELLAETTEKLAVDLVDSPEFEARQICFEASSADALDWVAISQ